MIFKSKKHQAEKNTDSQNEFVDRVCRFLLIFIDGISVLAGEKHPLYAKLGELRKVVQKVIRPKPPTDLGREIAEYFNTLALQKEFQKTEKEEVKYLVVQLTKTLQEMLGSTGCLDENLAGSIEKINAAENLEDIIKVKDEILLHINSVKDLTKEVKGQLEKQTEIAGKLSEKIDQLQAGSLVDSLTGVFNRAAYDLKIDHALREFERYKDSLALIMIDIDHFKTFNDTFGHKVGDKVLESVASSIKSSVRAVDQVFRYGGEEFVVLLSKLNIHNAKALADKVRRGVEREYFVHENRELKVTISLGVSFARDGDVETNLFERADKAMYAAKNKGRNRVEIEP